MHRSSTLPARSGRYVAVMMLGTALSGLGAAPAQAAPIREFESRAVQDLTRYCTTCWRNARLDPNQWQDATQEVFCRLLERVEPKAWSGLLKDENDDRREFLRAIDTVKKRVQRSRKWSGGSPELAADKRDHHERSLADDREAVANAANKVLSERQKKILQLCSEGWSASEIGQELQLLPERVSDEKYKALQKLRAHFAA